MWSCAQVPVIPDVGKKSRSPDDCSKGRMASRIAERKGFDISGTRYAHSIHCLEASNRCLNRRLVARVHVAWLLDVFAFSYRLRIRRFPVRENGPL